MSEKVKIGFGSEVNQIGFKKRRRRLAKDPAKRALQEIKQMKSVMKLDKPEVKNTDNTVTASAPTWSGLITTGNVIAQGTGIGGRIGDQVKIVGYDIRCQLVNNASTTTMTRVILYWDYDAFINAASQILVNLGTALTPLSPYRRDQRGYYKVLHDEVYLTDAVQQGQIYFRLHGKLDMEQTYQTGTSTPTKGVLRLLAVTDNLASAPSMDIYMRQYFTDL